MANVREALQEAFNSVKGTVEDTMKSVTGTVGETVDAVKHVDVKELLERHPWLSIGGFVAVGYFAYRLLEHAEPTTTPAAGSSSPSTCSTPAKGDGHGNGRHREPEPAREETVRAQAGGGSRTEDWGQMRDELKALAIGVPLSIIRDKLAAAGADAFRSQVIEIMNALTEKLGGKVIQERSAFVLRPAVPPK
jgi:hypothetical protein